MLTSTIADDILGLAYLCLMPARESLPRGQIIGMQDKNKLADAKAMMIALKSRSTSPVPAVEMSLVTAILLRAGKAEQVLFKDCSTFGSTDVGTIGAVGETLEVTSLKVDPEICTGTGWTRNVSSPDLVLALKSGNCGSDDVLLKAWSLFETEPANAVFRPRQSRSGTCGVCFGQQSPCGPVGKSSPSGASIIPNTTGELL